MSRQEQQAPAADIAGKYEITPEQLDEKLGGGPADRVQRFDLKTVFPEQLQDAVSLPRMAEKIWRRVMDESVSEYGGGYAAIRGTTWVHLWFEKIPAGAAKAKLPGMAERISGIYRRARALDDDNELDALFVTVKEKEVRQAQRSGTGMSRLIQHGLGANPTVEMFDLWLARTQHSILHAPQKTPFLKEIVEVVGREDMAFLPVWTPANEMIIGHYSVMRAPPPINPNVTTEPMRQDILGLFATGMQRSALAAKNDRGLGFVGFRHTTIANRQVCDLIAAYGTLVPPQVQKTLLMEVRGIPKGGMAPPLRNAIERLSSHFKAVMLETGIFSKDDYSRDVPRLHACGFDVAGLALPEVETVALIRKYAQVYKSRAQKTFIRGISSHYMLKIAREEGFAYLSGPAVHPPEKLVTGMRAFPIRLSQ